MSIEQTVAPVNNTGAPFNQSKLYAVFSGLWTHGGGDALGSYVSHAQPLGSQFETGCLFLKG